MAQKPNLANQTHQKPHTLEWQFKSFKTMIIRKSEIKTYIAEEEHYNI